MAGGDLRSCWYLLDAVSLHSYIFYLRRKNLEGLKGAELSYETKREKCSEG